jgi:hypothetical protein
MHSEPRQLRVNLAARHARSPLCKQGGVDVSVWRNHTEKGDLFNTTIRNSYKDEASGEWKETTSFSPTDLAVLSQLSSQAFQAITESAITLPVAINHVAGRCAFLTQARRRRPWFEGIAPIVLRSKALTF